MHPRMLDGWRRPEAPARYPDLTVVRLSLEFGHRWHLDFSREDGGRRWFASDAEICPAISWPWQEGFEPASADWKEIGFVATVEMHDRAAEIRPRSDAADQVFAVVTGLLFDHAAAKAGALNISGNA